jgi:hypothetical protein
MGAGLLKQQGSQHSTTENALGFMDVGLTICNRPLAQSEVRLHKSHPWNQVFRRVHFIRQRQQCLLD